MVTSSNKRKLAALARDNQEGSHRNSQSQNPTVSRINEEYITQVSEEIEGRVTKTLSQDFSRTESRILGALSKLDDFLLNPQVRVHYGTVPGTSRNIEVENQELTEDQSQNDPCPEADASVSRPAQLVISAQKKHPTANIPDFFLLALETSDFRELDNSVLSELNP